MSEPKPERRAGKRVAVRVPVSIKPQGQSADVAGFTRDLNTSGIFLYTDGIARRDLVTGIKLLREKQWVCCRASVVRVEDSGHAGSLGVAAKIRSIEGLPEIPV